MRLSNKRHRLIAQCICQTWSQASFDLISVVTSIPKSQVRARREAINLQMRGHAALCLLRTLRAIKANSQQISFRSVYQPRKGERVDEQRAISSLLRQCVRILPPDVVKHILQEELDEDTRAELAEGWFNPDR